MNDLSNSPLGNTQPATLWLPLALAALITGCGGGGGGGSSAAPGPDASNSVNVSGGVSKGPVAGATVSFWLIDQDGERSGESAVASTTTDSNGNFSVSIDFAQVPGGQAVPLLVESGGGSFVDESDQSDNPRSVSLAAGQGMLSLLPAGETSVAITPYTHALVVASRWEDLTGNFELVFDTNRADSAAILGFDLFDVIPAHPTAPAEGSTDSELAYAVLLGGAANAINNIAISLGSAQPTWPVIDAFLTDLSDGLVDGYNFGDPVTANIGDQDTALPTAVDMQAEVTRFYNNNYAVYAGIALPQFDEIEISGLFRARLSDLVFADGVLGACVTNTAALQDIQFIDEMRNLDCNGLNSPFNNHGDFSFFDQIGDFEFFDDFALIETGANISDEQIESLEGIQSLVALEALRLSFNRIENIGPVADLPNLTDLDIDNNPIADLNELVELDSLERLNLYKVPLSNSALTGITNLQNLKSLDLGRTGISDISGLGTLPSVEDLWLDENELTSISTLANFESLERLNVGGNQISDFAPLTGLAELRELQIWDNPVGNFNDLSGLTQLTSLGLSSITLSSLDFLTPLTGLEQLWLSSTRINDLTPIAGLTELFSLDISTNDLTDISPLASLTGLLRLRMRNNDVTSLATVASFQQLLWLDASANPINGDISALTDLEELRWLNLSALDISDISALSGKTEMLELELNNNPGITNISPLLDFSNATRIGLDGNDNISCADLDALVAQLPDAFIDRPDTCTGS